MSLPRQYVTQDGLSEFAYTMETYDGYSPITSSYTGDLPMCEQGNDGYYLSVGCAADGSFTIDEFSDAYCLQRVGTYQYLNDINKIFKSYFSSCYGIYSGNTDESVGYSAAGALISGSKACAAADSHLCQDTERINDASGGMNALASAGHSIANFNVANKAKYALGTLCLIGSLFMFLGILFTNRRKRRAMMHRKMRASRSKRSGSKSRRSSSRAKSSSKTSSSRSKSRSRAGDEKSRSSRSKSRSRSEKERSERKKSERSSSKSSSSKKVDDGVFA